MDEIYDHEIYDLKINEEDPKILKKEENEKKEIEVFKA